MTFPVIFRSYKKKAASGPTTLIYDTFTDTNGTDLSAHTIAPTNIPGASWGASSGTLTIQSNKAGGNTNGRYKLTSGVSDCKVYGTIGTVTGGGNYAVLYARWQDENNHWRIGFRHDLSAFVILEVNGGGITARASTAWTPANASHVTIVTLNGTAIAADADAGTYSINYTSSSFQAQTVHGLRLDAPNTLDDFKVTTL